MVDRFNIAKSLGGAEGVETLRLQATEMSLEILQLLSSELNGFWRKFVLRGGFALYHTEYSLKRLNDNSMESNVLRWTADIDLETISEFTYDDLKTCRAIIENSGYTICAYHEERTFFGTIYTFGIEQGDISLEIDILDCYRACALRKNERWQERIRTTITWGDNQQLEVATHSIEEMIAKKLLIRYYYDFRAQDALDLFYVFNFMELDQEKLRCAFLAEFSLWVDDQQVRDLCVYSQNSASLSNWLICFDTRDLLDKILQRVTLQGIEVLLQHNHHILDKCRMAIMETLSDLLSFNEHEKKFLLDILSLRNDIKRIHALRQGNMACSSEDMINLSSLDESTTPLLGEMATPEALFKERLDSFVSKQADTIVDNLRAGAKQEQNYHYINPLYISRCLELHIERGYH